MKFAERVARPLCFTLLACGLGLIGFGLWRFGLWGQRGGYAWSPEGWGRLVRFITLAAPAALAVPFAFRGRWPLGVALSGAAVPVALLGIGPVAAVLYLLVSCMCLGRLVLGRRWCDDWEPLTGLVLSALVGFALLSGVLNLAVHFRVNTQTTYALVLAVPLVLARDDLRAWLSQGKAWLLARREVRLPVALMGSLVAVLLALHLVYVALPERYWDGLVVHLRICTTLANEARWPFDCASFAYAALPMNGDLFYAVGYVLAGESAARLVDFLFFLMLLALLYGEVSRRFGPAFGLLFVALFASTPVAFIETGSLFIENVLAAFLLGSFLIVARRFDGFQVRDALALAALLGAAASTKLHGVIFLAAAFPFAVFAVIRRGQLGWAACTLTLALACAVGALLAAPPYLSAYVLTGNPVFPFFNAVFRSPLFPTANLVDARWSTPLRWDLLLRLTFGSHAYMEAGDGAFGFHFLALGAAGIVAGWLRRDRVVVLAVLVATAYVLGACYGVIYLRYLYPAFSIALLACAGICLTLSGRPVARGLTLGAGVALVLLNVLFLPTAGWILGSFDTQALFSKEKRTRLIEETVPSRRLVEAVNALAGTKGKVLMTGASFGTGLQGKCRFVSWYDPGFQGRFTSAVEPEAMWRLLRDEGITHATVETNMPPPNQAAFNAVLAEHAHAVLTVQSATLYAFEANP